jgi:hypothetical protein
LAIRIDRRLRSTDAIDVLSGLFILRGVPDNIRSDNGPEFIAKAVWEWIAAIAAKTAPVQFNRNGQLRQALAGAPARASLPMAHCKCDRMHNLGS